MGDWRISLKISTPRSLMMTSRMNLISAGSISLDSIQVPKAVLRIRIRDPVPTPGSGIRDRGSGMSKNQAPG